jgi:hypothetical protein
MLRHNVKRSRDAREVNRLQPDMNVKKGESIQLPEMKPNLAPISNRTLKRR